MITVHASTPAAFTCEQHWSNYDQGWACSLPYDGPNGAICVAQLDEDPSEANVAQAYLRDGRLIVVTWKPHKRSIMVYCIPNSNSNIPI